LLGLLFNPEDGGDMLLWNVSSLSMDPHCVISQKTGLLDLNSWLTQELVTAFKPSVIVFVMTKCDTWPGTWHVCTVTTARCAAGKVQVNIIWFTNRMESPEAHTRCILLVLGVPSISEILSYCYCPFQHRTSRREAAQRSHLNNFSTIWLCFEGWSKTRIGHPKYLRTRSIQTAHTLCTTRDIL
jgi:hypothetical protein